MRLSSADLEVIRTRPQHTELYLSIFQPTTIFRALVNNVSAAKGDRVIPFDTVSLGSWTAIEANFTLLVGTTAGGSEIGKIRIKSATSSTITVSENSNIVWADNLYLTVLRYVELQPIFPRIISDPANNENVIFYKDYDTPYTNQNSVLGTFVNMGSHRVSFISGSSTQIGYTSTGTHNLLGSSLSYSWFFEGGTPSGSTSAHPGLVTYSTPGHYTTRLIVSGSTGQVDTGYRYVSIYNKPGEGSNVPILSWEMSSLNGSRDEGGYSANFKVHENVNIMENSVIVVYAEDTYGSTKRSFGKLYEENILFVGYVMQNSIRYDYQHSTVEFDGMSLTGAMKQALGFSVSVGSVAAPTVWYELYDMDCRRAIYHYLRWHTTALNIADFQFLGTDQKIQFFDADRTSMFDAIDNLMRNTLLGQVVSDRQGKVWMEVEAKAYPNPTGSFTSVMDISKRDWMNEPAIEERLSDDVSFLELGGVAYTGVAQNTFSALIASAPGTSPSFRGKVDTRTGLAVGSQSQLNAMAGNVWANDNYKYPRISMDMTSNLRSLDIAPQETVFMSIAPSDTVRNKLIEGLYIPSGFDWRWDAKNRVLLPSIDFQSLVNGNVGDTVEIPISPADAGLNGGFSVPGLQIPPLPILVWPPSVGGNFGSVVVQTFQQAYGWYKRDAVLGTITQASRDVVITPATLTATLAEVQFDIQWAGIYVVNLYFTANIFITVGTDENASMAFSNSTLDDDLQNYAYIGEDGATGARRLSGQLSGQLRVNAGGVLLASVTSSQVLSSNTTFYASVVRVSAL